MNTVSKKDSYVRSIKQMLHKDTIFINCPKICQRNNTNATILHQKSILGREVLVDSYDTAQLFEELLI